MSLHWFVFLPILLSECPGHGLWARGWVCQLAGFAFSADCQRYRWLQDFSVVVTGQSDLSFFPLTCLLCDSRVIISFVCLSDNTSTYRTIVELEEGTLLCTDRKIYLTRAGPGFQPQVNTLQGTYVQHTAHAPVCDGLTYIQDLRASPEWSSLWKAL